MAGEASDLGNGSFVLPCGDEASLITCPDGWIGEAYDINNVWIYLEYESHYLDYYYMTDWTEDDFLDQVQSDIDELKDLDIFISSGDGPVYKGFTTKQVLGKDESYCYAWAPKGDGYLLVVLADYTAKPDFEAQILDAMALIAPTPVISSKRPLPPSWAAVSSPCPAMKKTHHHLSRGLVRRSVRCQQHLDL